MSERVKSRLFAMMRTGALAPLAFLGSSCGGGSSHPQNSPQNTIGPTAILNGSALASVNSHWVANCAVQVELAANGEFRSAVTDVSGTTYSSSGNWAASGTSDANASGYYCWVTELKNISGSTSSQTFSAGVYLYCGSSQYLGVCSFNLQSGAIP